MRTKEYTVAEMKNLLENMAGMYDLVRVVDPIECRILQFHDGGRISMNERCYRIWGAEQKCVNCSSAAACRTGCHHEKEERFQDQIFHIQSNPVKLKLPDGEAFDAVVELVSVDHKTKAGKVNDREAENAEHQAARFEALHDELTRVLNAGPFYELSRDMILKRPGAAWVMVTANIMNFRYINALFGVLKGNEALVRTGVTVHRIAEEADGLSGRLGADQFAMLLPQDRFSEEKLLRAAQELAEAFNTGIYTFHIHFGVYAVEDPSIPVSVMCGRANTALRTIRENLNKTVACFDAAMQKKSLFEQEIISGFEEALRTGQFRIYLQPLAGADNRILGAEALVRWCRPDGTILSPGDFIETLENTGLIHELDAYIWEQAVRQLSLWKNTDKGELTISVNMSTKDFFNLDVYQVLTGLVKKYGIDSRMLRLEITETALLKDTETTNTVVAKLRKEGFLVEIDDFGKGYSSLVMLKDIHADVLKIDMSLLHEIETNPRNKVILEAVIAMANRLGMDVITEGVETEEQMQILAAMGCHYYQGYYFSRPIPVAEFEKLCWPR